MPLMTFPSESFTGTSLITLKPTTKPGFGYLILYGHVLFLCGFFSFTSKFLHECSAFLFALAPFLTSRSSSEYVVCSCFFKRCDLSSCVSFNFPRLSIVFHVSSVIQSFLFTSHNAWFKLSILIVLEDTEAVPQFNFKGFHYITVPQPSYIKHFFGFRSFKHVIAPHNSSKTNFSITE